MGKEGYIILHDLLSKEEAASNIASLVLEREMQKVKTRLHYKTHRKF